MIDDPPISLPIIISAEKKLLSRGWAKWFTAAGVQLQSPMASGPTSQRPSTPQTGYPYFDTTLSQPIWWNGSFWVDASGSTV